MIPKITKTFNLSLKYPNKMEREQVLKNEFDHSYDSIGRMKLFQVGGVFLLVAILLFFAILIICSL